MAQAVAVDGKICVLGAGSWGSTLAHHLARAGRGVTLWMIEAELPAMIRERGENPLYLPGVALSPLIEPTADIEAAVRGAAFVISVVPSHALRAVFGKAAPFIGAGAVVASATKGIDIESGMAPSAMLAEFGIEAPVVLSGPTFAAEVAAGLPCAIVAASMDARAAGAVQSLFSTESFRVYTNADAVGVELGGALKNVIAVAAGISDGLELGANARAALITRGLAEMARLGSALGARRETFYGLSGLGDLVLTCTGALSRNRAVGMKIGRGVTLSDITKETRAVAEGVKTSMAVHGLSSRLGVETPIMSAVKGVLYDARPPALAVRELMTRDLKEE